MVLLCARMRVIMKQKLKLHVRKPFVVVLLTVLVAALVGLQAAYDWHTYRQDNESLTGQPIIASLVDDAVNGLNAPAPVDAATGEVYFPDVKLMLPAPSQNYGLRQVLYANLSNGSNFNLEVTTQGIVNQSETKLLTAEATAQGQSENGNQTLQAIFRQIPNLQACVRGVQLFYQPQATSGSSLSLAFTKQLASGKTLYAYTDSTCKAEAMPDLVNYMRGVQSY